MDQKNILPRGIAKPIEQQPDGTWIVRHHFRVVGTSENGEELVTFASSEYPEKPTLQHIQSNPVKEWILFRQSPKTRLPVLFPDEAFFPEN